MFTEFFKQRYLKSLDYYKSFYDDVSEYGNPKTAKHVFYFVPGLNGVPGQIRFAFPSLTKIYGDNFYVKCLSLPEFGARQPIWDKYVTENLDKKRTQIQIDLAKLLDRFERVSVIASSNGFYDFAAAWQECRRPDWKERLDLVWVACAPDEFERTPWEQRLGRFNGFDLDGHLWFAYPNHGAFKIVNSEASPVYKWRMGEQHKTFFKVDLESRFWAMGMYWDYVSIPAFNACLKYMVRGVKDQVDIPTIVLAATNDGFWHGKPRGAFDELFKRYIDKYEVIYKPTTHLWVTVPENLCEVLAKREEMQNQRPKINLSRKAS